MVGARIFGLSVALVSPFQPDGSVDVARACGHAMRCIRGGCDGVTLFGTTGEGYGLALAERRQLALAVAEQLPAGKHLTAGIMSCVIAEAAGHGQAALADGASHLLIAPPFYMKNPVEDGLYEWFARVFAGIGPDLKGVILYNIPGQTAVPLSVELIGRLRSSFGSAIVGIKDSSGDLASTEAYLAAHGDLAVLVGDERHLPATVAEGAQGSICGLANIAPELPSAAIHDGATGETMIDVVNLILSFPVLPAVKVLTAHVAGDPAFEAVRPPLAPLTADQKRRLIDGYEAIRGRERAA